MKKHCKTLNRECAIGCQEGVCRRENAYRPSNGSEGMGFTAKYCENCIHDNPDPNSPKKCEILTFTMCFDVYEPEYPFEWIERNGVPLCTKFVKWDWGNDGDPDDPDNPKAPQPPPDPRQYNLFPLWGKDFEKVEKEEKEPGVILSPK